MRHKPHIRRWWMPISRVFAWAAFRTPESRTPFRVSMNFRVLCRMLDCSDR